MTNLKVLLKKSTSTAEDGSDEQLFQTYWDKIERAEKAYASAERKRGRIVEKFNNELRPLEQSVCQMRYELIQKLMAFLSKKSLSIGAKKDVIDWIHEQLDKLMNSPFRGNIALDDFIDELQEHESALIEEPTEEEESFIKAEMAQMFKNSNIPFGEENIENIFESIKQGPQAFFESLMEEAAKHVEEEAFEEDVAPEQPKPEEPLSDKALGKLYKRLAQKIHPDRAKDDEDRQKRHELMLRLTEAKREKDTYSLLKMVRDHGDADDASFSSQQLEQLVSHLQSKLEDLREKKRSLKTDYSIEAMVYDMFHSRTNKQMDMKFAGRQRMLKQEINRLKGLCQDIKTVKRLKKMLNERNQIQDLVFFFGQD